MPTNKEIITGIFAEVAKGNGRLFLDALADDVVWKNPGSTSWSGTFVGKETVLRELLMIAREKLATPNTSIPIRILADGDFVVVQARGQNVTKEGKDYNNDYCFVIGMKNGKIATFEEYNDTELVRSALGERV